MEELEIQKVKDAWIDRMVKDCETIMKYKLPKALEQNNDGTYRNLTKVIAENIELIEKYGWKSYFTKFRDETGKLIVEYWEQHQDMRIRNDKKFVVDETNKDDRYYISKNIKNVLDNSKSFTIDGLNIKDTKFNNDTLYISYKGTSGWISLNDIYNFLEYEKYSEIQKKACNKILNMAKVYENLSLPKGMTTNILLDVGDSLQEIINVIHKISLLNIQFMEYEVFRGEKDLLKVSMHC